MRCIAPKSLRASNAHGACQKLVAYCTTARSPYLFGNLSRIWTIVLRFGELNRAPNAWTAYRGRTFKYELRPSAWIGQRRLHYKDWSWNPSSSAAPVCPRPMIAAGACACAGSRSGGFSSSVIAQGDCRLYGVAQDVLEGWLCGLIGSETGFGVVFPSALAAKRVSVQSERSVGASCPAPKGFEAVGARICY